jgi:hypothetical protein
MKILSLDMGKFKTVWLLYVAGGPGPQQYGKITTRPRELHDLLLEHRPERLVLESGPAAGWVCDLAAALSIPTQVANTNDERWRWRNNKKKSDRLDALKLAQMSEMGEMPRQWQSGKSLREGHISRMGNPLLREVLVEVSWTGVRTNAWMKQVYEDVRRGSDKRKKVAIVAVARRLFVRLWAMLRDGTNWKEPIPPETVPPETVPPGAVPRGAAATPG